MGLNEHRLLYNQIVYNYFRKNGEWPTYKQVEIELLPKHYTDDTLEVEENPTDDEFNRYLDEPVELSISEIHRCKGSQKDLSDFLRVLRYCVDRVVFSKLSGCAVKSKDVRRDLDMDELTVRKVGLLLGDSHIYEFSVSYFEDTGWEIGPLNEILHFEGVRSIDDYLARRATYALNNDHLTNIEESAIINPSHLIEKIAQTDPADIQATTANLMQIDNSYYINALQQSQRSFNWALIGAGAGVVFFIAAVFLLVFRQSTNQSFVSAIITASSGGVIEIIASIILVLHSRASNQAKLCHDRLNRMQRFLVAISHCENLEGDLKQTTRAELIRKLGDIQAMDHK